MPTFSDSRNLYYQRTGAPGVPAANAQNLAAIAPALRAAQQAAQARAAAAAAQQRAWEEQQYRNRSAAQQAPVQAGPPSTLSTRPGYQSWSAYQQQQQQTYWNNAVAAEMRRRANDQAAQRRAALVDALNTNMRQLVMEHQNARRELGKQAIDRGFIDTAKKRAAEGLVPVLTMVSQAQLWGDQRLSMTSDPDTWFLKAFAAQANKMDLASEISTMTPTGEFRFWMPDASLTAPDGTEYPEMDPDIVGEAVATREGGLIEGSVFPNSRMNVVDKYFRWASKADAKEMYDKMPQYVKDLAQAAAVQKWGPDAKPGSDKNIWNDVIDSTIEWNKTGEDPGRTVTDALAMAADGFDPETTTLSDYLQAKANGAAGSGFTEAVSWSGGREYATTHGGRTYRGSGGGGYDDYGYGGGYGGGGGYSGGGGGGGGDSATQTMVELSDRGTAQKLLNNAAYALLGRAATDAEVDAFLSSLNAKERENPTTVTATIGPDGSQSTTKQEGLSMEGRDALAKEVIRSMPEAPAEQMGTTFANMLWSAVTSATAGESSSDKGVL